MVSNPSYAIKIGLLTNVEEAGIGKVLALTSLAENAMSIVYKAVFYIAVIITLLNFRILSKRSQKKIAVIMSEAAAIVVAVLLLISFTPLTDIITTALAALLK